MRTAYILTVFLMLALCSTGCRSPQYIPYPVEKVVHDSVFVNRMSHDSVYRRDSIYVDRTGDTVYIYRDKYLYLYRDRTDTLFRDRVKTVREAYSVEKKLTWYQSALIFLGGLFLVYIIVTFYIKMKRP